MRKDDPVSKGQCGVTSAYLARELEDRFGLEPWFCEGRVSFDDGSAPIELHCWLRFESSGKRGVDMSAEDDHVLLDLTADQTGFDEPILFATAGSLRSRGVRYHQRSAFAADKIDVAHMWSRLEILQSAIEGRSAEGEPRLAVAV